MFCFVFKTAILSQEAIVHPLSIMFLVCKKNPSEHLSPELPNIYLSLIIKSVSELCGQRL
jgi:hypothetical protein